MSYIYIDHLKTMIAKSSQRAIAKAIGINPGTLNQYLNQAYLGKVESINEKIKAYIEREAERGDNWTDIIIQTDILQTINKTVKLIHAMRKIGVIYGPAGLGKTESAKQYVRTNPGAYLATARPVYKSVAGVITLLYETIFREVKNLPPRHASATLIERLRGSDAIVIIDDAHELTNDALEEVRAIHDASQCAFVLIGTEEILNRLQDRRTGKILAQMSSRIPVRRTFSLEPSRKDLRAVCEAYDVRNKEVIDRLAAKGRRGGLRLAVHQLKIARFLAQGKKVDLRHLIDAEIVSGEHLIEATNA